MSRRLRVGVLFGGRSVEHEVSLISARSVMEAIDPDRFEVVPIGITRAGRWLPPAPGRDPLALLAGAARNALPGGEPPAVPAGLPGWGVSQSATGAPAAPAKVDVVFPLVHGIFGEDGTMQGLLEIAGLPYVGSGVLGSALGMDKDVARTLFAAAGLPIVPAVCIRAPEWAHDPAGAMSRALAVTGLPCFVKPAGSGSSVGVSKVRDAAGLAPAITYALRYDRKALVERGVDAREIEIAVLGNDAPEASVPGEIVPCREFYDYEAKYLAESELIVPAAIPPATLGEMRRIALAAFRALDLAGMARVDFFLDRKSGALYLNEVNTIPGFTPVSMYPRLWEATGVPYRALISRLIDLALERHAARAALETSFSPARAEAR